jgi:hypothetical protein
MSHKRPRNADSSADPGAPLAQGSVVTLVLRPHSSGVANHSKFTERSAFLIGST